MNKATENTNISFRVIAEAHWSLTEKLLVYFLLELVVWVTKTLTQTSITTETLLIEL